MRPVFFIVWALCTITGAMAQTAISRNFTINNGLASNRVYYSLMDSDGFLWFSTGKGVSRYDGNSFKNFTTRDGLTDSEVFFMLEDSKKRIWFLTYNGELCYYQKGKFYNPTNTQFLKKGISATMYMRAAEDKWGNILFTTSGAVMVLKADTFKRYLEGFIAMPPYVHNGQIQFIASNPIEHILCNLNSDGSISKSSKPVNKVPKITPYYYVEGDSAYHFTMNKDDNYRTTSIYVRPINNLVFKKKAIKIINPLKLYFAKATHQGIVAGTANGLYAINNISNTLTFLGYENEQISSLLYDFEGNTWITTLSNGVFLQPNINLKKYCDEVKDFSEIATNPYTGQLWVGSSSKCNKIENGKVSGTLLLPTDRIFNEKVNSFYFKDADNFFVGADLGLVYSTPQKTILSPHLLVATKRISYNPYRKNLLVSSANGLHEVSIETNRIIENRIVNMRSTAALALNPEQILMGTNNGLYLINIKTQEKKLLLNSRINDMLKDNLGNIWLSSDASGLYLYKKGILTRFTETEGLHTNNINKMFIDKMQNLWLATNSGLIKTTYTNGKLNAKNYILTNILLNEQVNDVEVKNDTVIIATTSGLYYFIEKGFKKALIAPRLIINAIEIQGKVFNYQNNFSLPYHQNDIRIDFSGISYTTRNLNYRYKIQPGQDKWQYTAERAINLVDMQPGNYQVTIQTIRDSEAYSNAKQIAFTIIPPFYRTWWFYTVLFVLTVLIIVFATNYRIWHIRRKAMISQIIATSKQKALRAQMNPHFLFNSLISIQSFFLNNRNTEGQEYTSKFSKLIRNVLDNSDKEETSIEEEISMLRNYTDLENIRLKTPFKFIVTINNEIDTYNTYIPTMLLQPLVENAICHGINYLKEGVGVINLSFSIIHPTLEIIIKDNGVGLKKSLELNKKRNHISKGTQLITDRLEAINITRQNKIKYTVQENPEGGTIVKLLIPNEL